MTNSEKICSELGKLYFYKELEKSDLVYTTEDSNQEKELADSIFRVGNFIFAVQIKEMNDTSKNIQNWLERKVYKKAKDQTKETCKKIFNSIKFKNEKNADIIKDIDQCTIIPIIIFDIKENEIIYKKTYETSTHDLLIHIFDMKDFKNMCERLVSPMEMVRYLTERKEYVKHEMISLNLENQVVIAKTKYENAMLDFYIKKHGIDKTDFNKLAKFNTYLTLFEEHCINNKEHYKVMIEIMSQFNVYKMEYFIDRIDLIIEKNLKDEWYCNSYILDKQQSVLFISVPHNEFDLDYIDFISNIFMYKFKIRSVLTIISRNATVDNYELDFALIKYDEGNEELYCEALRNEFSTLWNTELKIEY